MDTRAVMMMMMVTCLALSGGGRHRWRQGCRRLVKQPSSGSFLEQ